MNTIAVIGKVFVDIKGTSFAPLHKDAKNVGDIAFSNGGTGRNVAQNLGILGNDVRFVSTVTNDQIGMGVLQELRDLNVNVDHVDLLEDNGMGMWLAVMDNNGDLQTSISKQPDEAMMEQCILRRIDTVFAESEAVAIDLDLSVNVLNETIELCREMKLPLYGVCGHLSVIERNRHLLQGFTGFICSREEAEILSDMSIVTVDDALRVAEVLAMKGAPLTIVTMSELGAVYVDLRTNEQGHVPTTKVKVADSTGAGDSFFSAVISELMKHHSIEDALRLGMRVAAKVIGSHENGLTSDMYESLEQTTTD
ncbi:ribokinase [Exiguobacterium sp. SH31]|uniref:carbohydrate kinase family protein n=1 Tax=unclassified Exiguobacterium TaxID=2644629 RepID=UPI0008C8A941|nr:MULTISPECIES: PfkB family carbohydrate kinase [unclassified Exiguobacterium]OGX78544.1 ribokinase [Exiguobacterium sp. SH31]TCI69389.1 ribokinase [Exiguobacterium sp. SH0S7]